MTFVTTPESLLLNVVRLVIDSRRGGTAFFVSAEARTEHVAPLFLVTARHVVEQAREVLGYFRPGTSEPELSLPVECALPDRWYFHPDPRVDVAILDSAFFEKDLTRSGRDTFLFAITTEDIVPQWSQAPNAIFEHLRTPQSIDELVFLGFPNNYYDPATGLPVMRRGLTATPLWLDYEGEPAFLLDAAVVHGSSGSPVFHINWRAADIARRTARLVGIISEAVHPKNVGRFSESVGDVVHHIYLGRVFKGHTIVEAIDAYRRDSGA